MSTNTINSVLIFRDIGNYHVARIKAAAQEPEINLSVIEVTSVSEYAEFRARKDKLKGLTIRSLGLSGKLDENSVKTPLFEALDELGPDVVFVPGWSMVEAILALQWCAARSVPSVIMSESTRHDFERGFVRERIKKSIVANASAMLVGGSAHKKYAGQLGFDPAKIFFGYDIVNNADFETGAVEAKKNEAAHRSRLQLPENFFFCAARLIEKKNFERLLEAYADYIKRSNTEPWHLVVAGPGPLRRRIDDKIEELGIKEHVQMLGALDYDDMKVCYGLANALVHASTTEQWGLVVNEAMSAGLPILVSERCGCADDLVEHGRNGFVFDPYDIAAISDALYSISDPACDVVGMGLNSSTIIKDWGPDRFGEGFKQAASVAQLQRVRKSSVLDKTLLHLLAKR